jgi:hypothetical protein
MSAPRYTDTEWTQWQEACFNLEMSRQDAPRHTATRGSMAKGQAEPTQTRSATADSSHQPQNEDWANECLFDCYNG